MDRGAWWAAVCGVTKSQARLINTSLSLPIWSKHNIKRSHKDHIVEILLLAHFPDEGAQAEKLFLFQTAE